MTSVSEQHVIDYLKQLQSLEPEPSEIAALGSRSPQQRRRWRPVRKAIPLAIAILAGSSALAAATALWVENPNPEPPARVVDGSVPSDVKAVVSVFGRPAEASDRSAEARAAIARIRSPYVIDAGSVRSVGKTPLGESAYVAYAHTDLDALPPQVRAYEPPGGTQGVYVAVSDRFGGIGADGPFPLSDIERGAAWGIEEVPPIGPEAQRLAEAPAGLRDGRYFTAVVPDGVAKVELVFRGGTSETHAVSGNVVIAHIDAGSDSEALDAISWLSSDGETIRTIRF